MKIVVIAPMWLEEELNESVDVLKRVYAQEVISEKINEDKGRYFVDQKRNQVNGTKMLAHLRILRDTNSLNAWLTEYDLYIENFNFCFGLAYGNVAIVSTYRLRDKDKYLYHGRLRKELSHEVGHLLGLKHCSNSKCVMYFSNTILDTDMKSEDLCPNCKSILVGVSDRIIRR